MSGLWPLGLAGVTAGGLLGVFAALRRHLVLVTIRGPSMEPALLDGDVVTVRRVQIHELCSGQIVVLARLPPLSGLGVDDSSAHLPTTSIEWSASCPPGKDWLIKRVVAVAGEPVPAVFVDQLGRFGEVVPPGQFLVLGDNARRSYDSRSFGYVGAEALLGRVIHRWSLRRHTETSVQTLSTPLYVRPVRSSRSVRSFD